MQNYNKIERCRICQNNNLETVLDLGDQVLTGVFPRSTASNVSTGPLRLVKCVGDDACGLLQLQHTFDLAELYGQNYGYRSGLNSSMVRHLTEKVTKIRSQVRLNDSDLVLDIGSNDATTLKAYATEDLKLVGIDPTGSKFSGFYPEYIELVTDFFSADLFKSRFPNQKAKIVTSFSMFYDLEDPISFMRDVRDILSDDGVWVFEQSYMPAMLQAGSYDTVCHEHLEYYSMEQIVWMADRVGLKIIGVEFNDTNGGSFSVTVRKTEYSNAQHIDYVDEILDKEERMGLRTLEPYYRFARDAEKSRDALCEFVSQAKDNGKTVMALGASTKGNVILQYCALNEEDIICVGEVNTDKYGCYTPGSRIPIKSEEEVLKSSPDYLVVLPWHFREYFINSPGYAGMKLVFPLPSLEVVDVR